MHDQAEPTAVSSALWKRAGVPPRPGLAEMAVLERWALTWHGAPRDADLAARYCRTALPGGRILLYGAGTHTAWLLDVLRGVPEIQLLGVLDRMAGSMTEFRGLPVHAVATAGQLGADYVLVAHTSFEQEMVTALAAAGYPRDRIRTLYSDPAYAALAEERIAGLAAAVDGGVDHLVVSSARSEIIPDALLSRLHGCGRAVQAFVGRADGLPPDGAFDMVDLRESVAALKRLVQRLRPRTIYVRTIIYKNFLLPLLKHWSPGSVVVGEPYDFTILWSEVDLGLLFGLDAQSIRMLRLGEQLAGCMLDLIVSKRDGAGWRDLGTAWARPSLQYFPAVKRPSGPSPAPGSAGDLVYAGFFPAASFLKTFRSGYNFVPLLAEVCRQGGLRGDLYNSGHMPGAGDAVFAEYMAGLPAPVRYHPRQPYDEMLRLLGGSRYGWLCDHRDRFQGDREVGVCNRWTGYVSAGLPTLIDRDWTLMATLTHAYSAGLVVHDLTPAAILAQLRAADWPALQAGTLRLRDHLERHNETVMGAVAAAFAHQQAG
ncbi:hypothetical protein [Nitrospirillum iridis]|uniref:Uncharacterized protein n=1 Tax=Nitrospirillum iridis TaxID=765888 RepID=A0A7X0ED15_9PROT|nr:hypothetical protein [Nitrospirillum iridis]MBB6252268.1 hypothetical protein [Nitrospirillum iridis]